VSADVSDLPLRVVLILAAFASGLIDAASHLGLGHVFTANMTGNILLLGFAVAGASGFSTSACLVSVGAFLVGAGVAGLLDRDLRASRRRLIIEIGGEGILIAAAATVAFTTAAKAGSPGAYVTIGLLAFAMGARNDTIRRLAVQTNLTTTTLTAALTGLASDFALPRPGQPEAHLAVLAARRRAARSRPLPAPEPASRDRAAARPGGRGRAHLHNRLRPHSGLAHPGPVNAPV